MTNGTACDEASGNVQMVEQLFDVTSCADYDPTQEIIFPPELIRNPNFARANLHFSGARVQFWQVTCLEKLLELKHTHPDAKIIVGNTEVGVEVRMKDQLYTHLVSVSGVQEMEQVEVQEDGVRIGAAVTLSTVQEKLKNIVSTLPAYKTRVLTAILEMLKWFAGKQIRNVASLGGNIMTSSPISDLNPLLLSSRSVLHLHSGVRTRVMDRSFFTGYRKCDVTPSEVLVAVTVPFTTQNEYFQGFKQARRRDDDIAIANAGLCVSLEDDVVTSVMLAFGGVAPKTVLASNTMQLMKGRKWNDELLQDVTSSLVEELEVTPSAPGGMTAYRTTLLPSFFFKFYLHVRHELSKTLPTIPPLAPYQQEVLRPLTRPAHSATHLYEKVPADQPAMDPIGRPLVHASARQQVTGEATYVDDVPQYSNELFGAFVLSTQAKAQIVSLDAEEALALPGVHAVVSAKDLPGERNKAGELVPDEEVFASTSVQYVGQPVCLVVADDEFTARRAAKLVKVRYEKSTEKPIITVQDAIAANSWCVPPFSMFAGDVEAAQSTADHTLSGEVHIGGQEHFYLESNAHLAVPGECNSITLFSGTQSPTSTQHAVAHALGVPWNQVVVRTKRLGGGFGGKESRSVMISVPAAVAAKITGRPVRVVLERAEDMLMTGTRHPFFAKWRVSFNKQGVLQAVEMDLYSNAGFSLDLSYAVMERALLSSDNAYNCPNVRVTGHICRTNLPSNTAFRGFGGPQAMFVREDMMARVAAFLGLDAAQVREVNLYKEGDRTHFGQVLESCTVRRCWHDVKKQALYTHRKELVDQFNRSVSLILY
ncbi:Aldehyde oxidase/xanthine dehydrogenase molybdopterin binding [Trinorchestia longiramus]|nr:Aldehyde oxidase/xanthine dehydrogenase molybdopterin binding [Trinorchestia longiramus]